MTEYVSLALREAAKEVAVLLYVPGTDPFLEELIKHADRVFYFDEGRRADARVIAKANARVFIAWWPSWPLPLPYIRRT